MDKQKILNGLKIGMMVLVPACIFYYLFMQAGLARVFQELRQVNIFIFLMTLIISIGNNVLLTAFRWQKILERIGYRLSYQKVLFIKMGAEPFVGLFPVKAGELSRALYLKKMDGVNFADGMFSIVIGYILNFVVLIVYMLIGGASVYSGAVFPSSVQAKMMVAVCFASLKASDETGWFSQTLAWVDRKISFRKHLHHAMLIFFDWRIVLFSFVIWFTEFLNFYLLSVGLGIELPFLLILLVLPAVIILSHVPISIAGLGIREGLIFIWLANYAQPEQLLSLGLLYSFVENIFPIIFGGLVTGHFVEKILSHKHL